MAKKKNSTKTLTPAAEARLKGLVFIGAPGSHITGIPPRDLAPEEVGQLTIKQIERALFSGLYEYNGGTNS